MSICPKRARRPAKAVAWATVAAVCLAGCGADLNPGRAATVNGTTITQGEVDDLVRAACAYIEINNETSPQPVPQALADLRAILTSNLISFDLTGSATEELGLTILPASVDAIAGQTPLPDGLSDDDVDLLRTFFNNGAESQVAQATIGAHLNDESVTTSADVTPKDAAGAADYIQQYFDDADVTVNPAYGSWDGSAVTSASGSLSDGVSEGAKARIQTPESGPADPSELPPSQVCG